MLNINGKEWTHWAKSHGHSKTVDLRKLGETNASPGKQFSSVDATAPGRGLPETMGERYE